MSLYFVRHGQTEWNALHRIQGRNDIPLNEVGKLQAKKTSELFQDIHIDQIFCSPLIRAQQTAQAIQQVCHCPIQIEPSLIERCFGEQEGKSLNSVEYLWSFEENLCPGAEDMHAFFHRVQSFLKRIQPDLQNKNYCIVAHGGVFLPVYDYFYTVDKHSDLMKIVPPNCTLTKFE